MRLSVHFLVVAVAVLPVTHKSRHFTSTRIPWVREVFPQHRCGGSHGDTVCGRGAPQVPQLLPVTPATLCTGITKKWG